MSSPLMVRVIAVDLKTCETIADTCLNWNRPKSKQWLDIQLGKWFLAGVGVQLLNVNDKEPG